MDYAWLLAYVGFGAAALHPSPVRPAESSAPSTLRRFALLALPVALLPAAIATEGLEGRRFSTVDGLLLSALLVLMLGRLASLVYRLHNAQRELHEQNRLKDELISVVSHDLRTPLTSIMGYLELALADDTDAETARDFLEVVKRNTGRLHRLVEDLLFVSRVQAGREALEIAPVDVGRLVDETVAAAVPAADAADVVLRSVVLTDDVVLADAHRLAEVLENLLSNAIKFTPPGGRVDVWAGRDEAALVLRVSDTGVGIAEDDRRHLFDRFFRAHGSEGVPGAGLGLSIVKAIVEAHDGAVTVSSEVGAGATFEVRLPLLVAEPAAPAAVAA
jgi:signal transduction histidine kinase